MNSSQPTSTGIARFIPGLALLKEFSPTLLRSELLVAVTVFAVLVPSAMAYGDLAGVTPVAGLYVALGAPCSGAVFCWSLWHGGDAGHTHLPAPNRKHNGRFPTPSRV